MREELKRPLLEIVRIMGITLAVYAVMRFLLPLVLPFLIAFFLAKQIHPLVEKLHNKLKIKRGIISAVILLLFLLLLLGIVWFLGEKLIVQLQNLVTNLPVYRDKVTIMWKDYCIQLESWTGIQAETLNLKVTEAIPKLWETVKGTLLPSLMSNSFSWVKSIIGVIAVCTVIGISTLLMVKEYSNIKKGMEEHTVGQAVLRIARRVYQAGGGYVKAQFLIMLAVSIVCIIGLFCAGNPYALLAGMGIGLCDALPFLGTGTVFIPWAIWELINGRYMMAAVYAVIYTIANLTRELLEPKLVGDKLGMPPLVVIISVYIGLCIYGLWGFALGPISYILIREIWRECFRQNDNNYLDKGNSIK